MGLTNVEAYLGFSDKVVENAKNVKNLLVSLKQQGKKSLVMAPPQKATRY